MPYLHVLFIIHNNSLGGSCSPISQRKTLKPSEVNESLSVNLWVVELELVWNSLAPVLCFLSISSQENCCKEKVRPFGSHPSVQ